MKTTRIALAALISFALLPLPSPAEPPPWAKAHGCATYDFWCAPNEFVESDPLWGVWKFKEGFGGQVVRHIGAWDYAPSPLLYRLYTVILPRVLDVMRWRGRRKTQASLD